MKNDFIKIVLIAFTVMSSCICAYALPPDKSLRSCKKDSDCVVVDGAFCKCDVAGAEEQYAVNKKYEAKVKRKYQSERDNSTDTCPEGFSDEAVKKCANLRAVCLAKICEVR
jgi:hypothetical protein